MKRILRLENKKDVYELIVVIIVILASIITIFLESNNKDSVNNGAKADFERMNTLLMPSEDGNFTHISDNKIKFDKYKDWLEVEKLKAGIMVADEENWNYLSTDVNYTKLKNNPNDLIAEKLESFVSKDADNFIIYKSIYYYNGNAFDWSVISSSSKIINKNTKEIKDINNN